MKAPILGMAITGVVHLRSSLISENLRFLCMGMNARLRHWARAIKSETSALYLAVRDPRTPWYAKAMGVCVVAYALSPIDLIPDFVPVIGYLDDLLILPAGLWAVRRMIPTHVLTEARERARGAKVARSWTAALVIVAIWMGAVALTGLLVWRVLR